MIRLTLILVLSTYLVSSQRYGASGEPQRGKPLHFSDLAKHFESVTSQSTSMQDLEKAVEPALAQIRKRRSDDNSDAGDSDADSLLDNGSAFRNTDNDDETEEETSPESESTFVDKLENASEAAKKLLVSLTDIYQYTSGALNSFSPLSGLLSLFSSRRSLDPEVHPVLSRVTRGIRGTIAKFKARLLQFFESKVEPLLNKLKDAFKKALSPRPKRSSDDEPANEKKPIDTEESQPISDDDSEPKPFEEEDFRRRRAASTESSFLGSESTSETDSDVTRERRELNAKRPHLSRWSLDNDDSEGEESNFRRKRAASEDRTIPRPESTVETSSEVTRQKREHKEDTKLPDLSGKKTINDDSGPEASIEIDFRRRRALSAESSSRGPESTLETNSKVTREKRHHHTNTTITVPSESKVKTSRKRRSAAPQNANGIFLGALNTGEEGTFRTPDLDRINGTAR